MGRERPRVVTRIAAFFVNKDRPVEIHAFGRRRIFSTFLPYYFLGLCIVLSASFPSQHLTRRGWGDNL